MFSTKDEDARNEVLAILQTEEIESYVAYNSTKTWRHKGGRTYVVPQPDLVAAWCVAGAGVSYHHSHPDDRCLSPSDLQQLHNPGLYEIWAHCRSGISYKATIAAGVEKHQFKQEHDHLNGTISEDLARMAIEDLWGVSLSHETYRDLSDRAFCEALSDVNLLVFKPVSPNGNALSKPCDAAYLRLVDLAGKILDRSYPPPAVI